MSPRKTRIALAIALAFVFCTPALGREQSLLARLENEISAVVARTQPSVVEVRPPSYRGYTILDENGPVGAGVIVGDPPLLVTSAAFAGSAASVRVRFSDGHRRAARLLGRDADLGVAVYRFSDGCDRDGVEIDGRPVVNRGHFAIATGAGVSDLDRPISLGITRGSDPVTGRFLADGLPAHIASGQPVFSADGCLLGIYSRPVADALYTSTYRAYKLAFEKNGTPNPALRLAPSTNAGALANQPAGGFISCSVIARVVADLREHGRIRHAYLGIIPGPVMGKGAERGVVVRTVLEGSPAARSGVEAGMRISSAGVRSVLEAGELDRILIYARPGRTLRLQIVGRDQPIAVMLGDRGEAAGTLRGPGDLGLDCMDLDSGLAAYLNLSDGTRGVVVREVEPGSPAAKAGVTRGAIIVGAGGEPVADLKELLAAVAESEAEIRLSLLVEGKNVEVRIRLAPARGGKEAR